PRSDPPRGATGLMPCPSGLSRKHAGRRRRLCLSQTQTDNRLTPPFPHHGQHPSRTSRAKSCWHFRCLVSLGMGRPHYSPVTSPVAPRRSCRRLGAALALGSLIQLWLLPRSKAEDRLDYRYEDYAEEGGRIHVRTHGAYAEVAAAPWLSLKGNYTHD